MPSLGPTELILVLVSIAMTIVVVGGAVVVVRLLFGWRPGNGIGAPPRGRRTGPPRTVTVNRRTHDR